MKRVIAWGFAAALGGVLLVRLGMVADPMRARADGPAVAEGGFGLGDDKFEGSVFLVGKTNLVWFGTYVNGDAFTGRVVSTEFPVGRGELDIPILGYPNKPGNALDLEFLDPAGSVAASRRYAGPNPREWPGDWRVDTAGIRARRARLVLTDGDTHPGGWLGVSPPLDPGESGPFWLRHVRRDYGWFAVSAVALAALLFVPGLAWGAWRGGAKSGSGAGVALPGLLALASLGLGVWLAGPAAMRLPATAWLAANFVGALGLARQWRRGGAVSPERARAWKVYGCIVVAALAFGILPLEVAQEIGRRTTGQGRMIASPPDHAIPYTTAKYFYQGKNGREESDRYFGSDWSVASRGPLAAFSIAAGFVLLRTHSVESPQDSLPASWPASPDGFYIARILGILTNALVILAAAALAGRLAVGAEALVVCWLGVAPAVAIDTDFLWPKLLATAFILLAVRLILDGRPAWRVGGALALAYLSHPLGGLLAPPVLLFLLQREGLGRAGLGKVCAASAWLALCLAPWFAYKAWVGRPDVFFHYPFGDGRGFLAAAGAGSWLKCRWDNLWLTLAPGGFYLSGNMPAWLEGPLSPPLRWAIGYAKTLPGGLGLGCFLAAVVALFRAPPAAARGFRLWLLGGVFGIMLLFWGYSFDGLGRNTLTPLSVLTIVYAAAVWPAWRGWPWLLALAAGETLSVRAIGVAGASAFRIGEVDFEAVALGAIVLVAGLTPAVYGFLWLRPRSDTLGSARPTINEI